MSESSSQPTPAELPEQPRIIHPRRLARESVAQGLYQWLITGDSSTTIRLQLQERAEHPTNINTMDHAFFLALWEGVMANTQTLQGILQTWLDRPWGEISYVERAVL